MKGRRPYRPRRVVPTLGSRERENRGDPQWPWLLLAPLAALAVFLIARAFSNLSPAPEASPTPTAATTRPTDAAPTRILYTPASPTPTASATPAPPYLYLTQSGDTLLALAARFGVKPEDIQAPQGLRGATTLDKDQLLVIPRALNALGPGYQIVPDSELVFSGSAAGFDPRGFADEMGGYLATHRDFVDDHTLWGGDVILRLAQHHAVNPRLLTALLEFQSGWVTDPNPPGEALLYPYGYLHAYRRDLAQQLDWAASALATGYYGWRAGTLTELTFSDGSRLRLDPTLNAGTVALQYFFAQYRNRPAWDEAVGENGFAATYRRFFGDPFSHQMDSLIPQDLTQPPLRLPFLPGHTWYFSGGPHGAWERGGAWAALDFAPPSTEGGCAPSTEWVTAVASGLIVRADHGSVLLDLDGDGREATGWVILYLHLADEDRVQAGQFVEAGDRIGHPSCEGGIATGTHVHLARKYNGEWIPADGVVPFALSGWAAHQGAAEYAGTLTRDGVTVKACRCTASWTAITADP